MISNDLGFILGIWLEMESVDCIISQFRCWFYFWTSKNLVILMCYSTAKFVYFCHFSWTCALKVGICGKWGSKCKPFAMSKFCVFTVKLFCNDFRYSCVSWTFSLFFYLFSSREKCPHTVTGNTPSEKRHCFVPGFFQLSKPGKKMQFFQIWFSICILQYPKWKKS